ncbi:hypothetical protein NPIL_688241 [Nephila pilipes]|uniref:Uncharacterized protein n=1 Tax=Nephila pilipes TaxID=299642 RepID=A0A8X6P2W7_NEPPI|nr:hypothetical protein NPIL_688241 [Nephila pilipes]
MEIKKNSYFPRRICAINLVRPFDLLEEQGQNASLCPLQFVSDSSWNFFFFLGGRLHRKDYFNALSNYLQHPLSANRKYQTASLIFKKVLLSVCDTSQRSSPILLLHLFVMNNDRKGEGEKVVFFDKCVPCIPRFTIRVSIDRICLIDK